MTLKLNFWWFITDERKELFSDVLLHVFPDLAISVTELGPNFNTESIRVVWRAFVDKSYASKLIWFCELRSDCLKDKSFPHLLDCLDFGNWKVDSELSSVFVNFVLPLRLNRSFEKWKRIDSLLITIHQMGLDPFCLGVIEKVFDFAVFDGFPSERKGDYVVEPRNLVHTFLVIFGRDVV